MTNSLMLRGLLIACVVLLATGCVGKINPDSGISGGEHIFEGCKAYLKHQGVAHDEAVARAQAYKRDGNKKKSCEFNRKALGALMSAKQSFKAGKCDKFHKVANSYISWKVKGLQARLANQRKRLRATLRRECS